MIIGITGHHPDRLYGYDLTDERYLNLKNKFRDILIRDKCKIALSGMALGVDTLFAQTVLELRERGQDIKLYCIIPCIDQECMWSRKDKQLYKNIVNSADEVIYTSKQSYKPRSMQKRNEYIVEHCDKLIAVWDRIERGGTYNCIQYAIRKCSMEVIDVEGRR